MARAPRKYAVKALGVEDLHLMKELRRAKFGVVALEASIYSSTMKIHSQDIPFLPDQKKKKGVFIWGIASFGS